MWDSFGFRQLRIRQTGDGLARRDYIRCKAGGSPMRRNVLSGPGSADTSRLRTFLRRFGPNELPTPGLADLLAPAPLPKIQCNVGAGQGLLPLPPAPPCST